MLTTFLSKNDKNLPLLLGQYLGEGLVQDCGISHHGDTTALHKTSDICWWPGFVKSHGIKIHGINPVHMEYFKLHIDGLGQDWSNSIANAL